MSPRTQPLAVLVAASMIALAACGDDPADSASGSEPAADETVPDETVADSPTTRGPATTPDPTTPDSTTPATSASTAPSTEATATTAAAEQSEPTTCSSSERIIAVDTSTMAYLMDLGVVPVGAAAYESGFHGPDAPAGGRFAPALAELGPVEDVVPFDRFEPNIEQLAALEPTLVIGASQFFEYVPAFENVADGVQVERYDEVDDPAGNLLAVADLVGCTDVGEQLVDDLGTRIDALTIASANEVTVDVTRWFDESVDIYLSGLVVEQLEQFGASVPLAESNEPDDGDNRMRDVSYERLDLLTSDVLVRLVVPGGEFDEATLAALTTDPLYQQIPAVAGEQVIDVDSFAGQGYAGMNALADELERLAAELDAIAG